MSTDNDCDAPATTAGPGPYPEMQPYRQEQGDDCDGDKAGTAALKTAVSQPPTLPSSIATPNRRGHVGSYDVQCPYCRRRAGIRVERPTQRPLRMKVTCPPRQCGRQCRREFWAVFDDLLKLALGAMKDRAQQAADADGGEG